MTPLRWHRLLVLAPHTDDEISCAGTIARAVAEGAEVRVVAFSDARDSNPGFDLRAEFRKSCNVLGVKSFAVHDYPVRWFHENRQDILTDLIQERKEFGPDVVLCPCSDDTHQDHEVIHAEAVRAFRGGPLLLGYECPGNQRRARLDLYVEVASQHVATVLAAEDAYQSQRQLRQHWGGISSVLAQVRGQQCRRGFAEAFEVLGGVL